MVQLEDLLYKHEKLSSDSQYPHKKYVIAVLGKWRWRMPGPGWPNQQAKVQSETVSQKGRREAAKEDTWH